jgi:hypothetical protein
MTEEQKTAKRSYVKVTKNLMLDIAEQMAEGKSLKAICRTEGMPEYHAITRAVTRNAEFYDIYREGRVRQAEYYFDLIDELASDPLPTQKEDGTPYDARWLNAEVTRRKTRIEALKWALSRVQPYGIRDKKDDAPQQSSLTISWAGGDVAVTGKE